MGRRVLCKHSRFERGDYCKYIFEHETHDIAMDKIMDKIGEKERVEGSTNGFSRSASGNMQ